MKQYTEGDMTPFFPADVKPTRIGVYHVRDIVTGYSYWDGIFWRVRQDSIDDATCNLGAAYIQNKSWRGLRFDPTKGAA